MGLERVHPRRLEIAAFFGDPDASRLSGRPIRWPPPDPVTLYEWGWDGTLADLGKEVCLRAAIAAHGDFGEVGWRQRAPEGSFERRALVAALSWTVMPDEERRKEAGRIASDPGRWSNEKVLANMAGARRHWRSAVGVMLTGNPRSLSEEHFKAICQRIQREVRAWALGYSDPAAGRLDLLGESWARPLVASPDASHPPAF